MLARLRNNPVFETIFFAGYFAYKKLTCKDTRADKKCRKTSRSIVEKADIKSLKEYHIAIICDEFTYVNFSKECHLHVLTPNNWRTVFAENDIDLFLCESAWNGLNMHKQCWRGKIYKNHNVLFETRKILFRILDYCKENHIPTAFWNKEDPTYFGNQKYDFVDTALHFQYIFTTAAECISQYEALNHCDVFVMPFGFSPQIYNPLFTEEKQNRAIFAGSWYGENAERCQAETELFQKVLDTNIPLVIYDRHSSSKRKDRQYPKRFLQYVKDSLSQETLSAEIKRSKYAININTVTNSETMLARRIYELMASNVYIISNEAKAMQQFVGRYSTTQSAVPVDTEQICRTNVDYVFQHCTNKKRLEDMLCHMQLPVLCDDVKIAVYCEQTEADMELSGDEYSLSFVQALSDIDKSQYQYFIVWDGYTKLNIAKLLPHFVYLDTLYGVCAKEQSLYQIVEDNENENVLFPIVLLNNLLADKNTILKKYHV